ncbi:hypothetical protein LIER_39600 [Lithospermum erythrorhizon]|uniref:Uncharacterized protein n=1 Tax=Lithospermum erythrorhizon TaxID=34254 RepID=A0AAV3QH85_LITER
MARQFQIEPNSEKVDDETYSKPRRNGCYARHGVEFKIRKSTGADNVLSESDVSDDVRLHLFNNTFLASPMEGKFIVLLEITLATTQVFVDEIFHIKISPNWTRRTKEKALKKINGDHLEQFNLVVTYCTKLMKAQPGSSCYLDCWKSMNIDSLLLCPLR